MSVSRCSASRALASGEGAASPEGVAATVRSVRWARRAAARRRVRGSLGGGGRRPRASRRARAKAVERGPGLHDPLLGGVLRIGGAAGDEVGRAKCDPLICLHEVSIGGFIALLGSLDELRFLQWTALHCLLLPLLCAAGSAFAMSRPVRAALLLVVFIAACGGSATSEGPLAQSIEHFQEHGFEAREGAPKGDALPEAMAVVELDGASATIYAYATEADARQAASTFAAEE